MKLVLECMGRFTDDGLGSGCLWYYLESQLIYLEDN